MRGVGFRRRERHQPGRSRCDIRLEVPEIAVGLRVYIHMLTNTASCTSVGAREVGAPGTMGTVAAEFS